MHNANKTLCVWGHELDEYGARQRGPDPASGRKAGRACKICEADRQRMRRARLAGKPVPARTRAAIVFADGS